jgi:hypothetical protein
LTRKLVLGSMVCMGAAILAAYPLALIGWDVVAGLAFIIAMLVAWIAACAGFIAKLWRQDS